MELPVGVTLNLAPAVPTIYFGAPGRWKSKVEGTSIHAVNSSAKLILNNIWISRAVSIGIQMQHLDRLELYDCLIERCTGQGIGSLGSTKMRRCVVQFCGDHINKKHGAYLNGIVDVKDCIFRYNSGFQFTVTPGPVSGTVDHCLFVGLDAPYACVNTAPGVTYTNCTFIGRIYQSGGAPYPTVADGNVWYEWLTEEALAKFPLAYQGIFWPANNTPPVGAYPYDVGQTAAKALELWNGGYMFDSVLNPDQPLRLHLPEQALW